MGSAQGSGALERDVPSHGWPCRPDRPGYLREDHRLLVEPTWLSERGTRAARLRAPTGAAPTETRRASMPGEAASHAEKEGRHTLGELAPYGGAVVRARGDVGAGVRVQERDMGWCTQKIPDVLNWPEPNY